MKQQFYRTLELKIPYIGADEYFADFYSYIYSEYCLKPDVSTLAVINPLDPKKLTKFINNLRQETLKEIYEYRENPTTNGVFCIKTSWLKLDAKKFSKYDKNTIKEGEEKLIFASLVESYDVTKGDPIAGKKLPLDEFNEMIAGDIGKRGVLHVNFLFGPGAGPEVQDAIKKIITFRRIDKTLPHFYMLELNRMGYDLKKMPLPRTEIDDVTPYYNDEVLEKREELLEWLVGPKNGLAFLRGEPGTGKTSFIKYVIKKLCDVKKFVLVPANSFDRFFSPETINLISQDDNMVFILEDAEALIRDREKNLVPISDVGMLLNVADGLLADSMNIKFLISYNTDEKNIDRALKRPGRMRLDLNFKPLIREKVEKLVEKLDLNIEVKGDMKLAEIFNPLLDTDLNREIRIGFGRGIGVAQREANGNSQGWE